MARPEASRAACPGVGSVPTMERMSPRIELVEADITEQDVDAIVNAANASLLGGGGVDGAIHRRGGPEILAECREIRRTRYPDGLPTGLAVATTAGDLPARWVIHTVGPVYARSRRSAGPARVLPPRVAAASPMSSARPRSRSPPSRPARTAIRSRRPRRSRCRRCAARRPMSSGPVRALRARCVRRVRTGARLTAGGRVFAVALLACPNRDG